MARLGLFEQAGIAQRLKFVCQQSFDGDPAKLAMILGLKHAQIKQMMAGKIVSRDYFELVLTRLSRLDRVCNPEWVRTNQGKPFGDDDIPKRLVLGLDDPKNGVMHIDASIVPKPTPQQPQPSAPPAAIAADGAPKIGTNGTTIVSLITRLSERVDRVEKTLSEIAHETRSLARKEIGEAGVEWERGMEVRLKREIEEILDRQERHTNTISRVESIAVSARNDISRLGARVEGLAHEVSEHVERVTAPGESVKSSQASPLPPPAPRKEYMLAPGEYMQIAEYIACEFEWEALAGRDALAEYYRTHRSNLSRYLTDASTILQKPVRIRRDGLLGSEHSVAALRAVAEFLGEEKASAGGNRRKKQNFLARLVGSMLLQA